MTQKELNELLGDMSLEEKIGQLVQVPGSCYEENAVITGGMNNAAFQVRCAELLQKSPPNTYAVVLINIRNFKLINESFGSVRGDAKLVLSQSQKRAKDE